jgi:hypothetical protein
VVTDLAVAPLDLVARVVNAHKDFRLILSRSKDMTLFLLTFARELSTTKDQFWASIWYKNGGPRRGMTPYELIN